MAEAERAVRWVHHVGFPGDKVCINAEDFDPEVHSDHQGSGSSDPRADRAKSLTKLPAAEVQALAEAIGVEYTNKGAAIEAILEAEFPAD